LATVIRPAVAEESAEKLTLFDRRVAGSAIGGDGFSGGSMLPIKAFAKARAESVAAQLAGRSEGVAPARGGPGGPPGGGRGRSGPGGPGGFGPATFMADALLDAFDADRDRRLTEQEFLTGLTRWFDAWDAGGTGVLSRAQLTDGLNDTLRLRPGPPRGGAVRRE